MSQLITDKVDIKSTEVVEKSNNETKLSGFGLFKFTFASNMSGLVKINMLTLLFALPLIIFAFMFQLQVLSIGLTLPFSGNIGVGYPIVTGLEALASDSKFYINCMMYMSLMPCSAVFGIGLAGTFNAVRCMTYGTGTKSIVRNFFAGVKRNLSKMAVTFLIWGISAMAVLFTLNAIDMVAMDLWLQIVCIVGAIVQFVIITTITLFVTTQTARYNVSLGKAIKNSVIFALGVFPLTAITLILSAIPVAVIFFVMGIELVNVMVITIALLMLFSFIALVWTVYGNWVFDNFVNEKAVVVAKEKNIAKANETEQAVVVASETESSDEKQEGEETINASIDNGAVVKDEPVNDAEAKASDTKKDYKPKSKPGTIKVNKKK